MFITSGIKTLRHYTEQPLFRLQIREAKKVSDDSKDIFSYEKSVRNYNYYNSKTLYHIQISLANTTMQIIQHSNIHSHSWRLRNERKQFLTPKLKISVVFLTKI